MPETPSVADPTLALNTKLEDDFVNPLTVVRGSLEILRDFPDLAAEERKRFLAAALRGCAWLERSVEQLAKAVYAAGQQSPSDKAASLSPEAYQRYASRVKILAETETIEIDFSDFEFSSSKIVDDFYDVIDELIVNTGRDWYFLVNYHNCGIWPEAWVAFAHRGKKINVNKSLGTVRFAPGQGSANRSGGQDDLETDESKIYETRELALARIDEMKAAKRRDL